MLRFLFDQNIIIRRGGAKKNRWPEEVCQSVRLLDDELQDRLTSIISAFCHGFLVQLRRPDEILQALRRQIAYATAFSIGAKPV